MAELKLSGNHLKGSRPVLSFDAIFDEEPHLQLLKEVFIQIFSTPKRHHKSKPFFDHIISFAVADGHVWLRNYQVLMDPNKTKPTVEDTTLVEVSDRNSNEQHIGPVFSRLLPCRASTMQRTIRCALPYPLQVGPRACLNPIKIFNGSFGGAVIYENPAFVSPNLVRWALQNGLE
jgi:ribosome biogenesis protein BRX1